MKTNKKWNVFLAGMGAMALTFGLGTTGCASGPKATPLYERGDYAEFSPTAVLNIIHPDKIMTTAEREREAKNNSGGGGSLLGALAKAAVEVAVDALNDAISVDLDEDAIGTAGAEMVRAGFAKAGIPLVDKDTVYNSPAYKTYMEYSRNPTNYANKYAEPFAQAVGAKSFALVRWDIEIASGGLLDGVNVFPKVTLNMILYNEKGQEVAFPGKDRAPIELKFEGNFAKAVKPISSGSGKGPTAEIDNRYVWSEGTPMVLGQYDKEIFTEMTLRAMQMCVDKFVDYVGKGKQDYPGTYKGKK